MGAKVRAFLWLLTAVCFAYNLYLWGGLKATPQVGKLLMNEAPYQNPLAATYMFLGARINGTLGRTDKARAFAARKFPELVSHPEQLQYLAVTQFRRAQDWWGSFCYSFGPILLVLSLVLHWRRQRPIRSFGTKR